MAPTPEPYRSVSTLISDLSSPRRNTPLVQVELQPAAFSAGASSAGLSLQYLKEQVKWVSLWGSSVAELTGWCKNSPSVAIAGAVATQPIAQLSPGPEPPREMISALGFPCETDLGPWAMGRTSQMALRGVVRTIILLN